MHTLANIDEVFTKGALVVYKNKETILKPDDSPSDIYYVESGYVRLYSFTEWGDEKLHLIFRKGEFFPTFWIFDGKPITKYYEAIGEVRIRKINKESFISTLYANPGLMRGIFQRIISVLEVYSDRIDNLEFTKAYERVVSRIICLGRRFGRKDSGKVVIDVPLTHADIALSIAITRETASRECKKLEDSGLIKYDHKKIIINDMKKLEEELSSHHGV